MASAEEKEALMRQIAEQASNIELMKQKTKEYVNKLKLEHQQAYNSLKEELMKSVDASQKLAEENNALREKLSSTNTSGTGTGADNEAIAKLTAEHSSQLEKMKIRTKEYVEKIKADYDAKIASLTNDLTVVTNDLTVYKQENDQLKESTKRYEEEIVTTKSQRDVSLSHTSSLEKKLSELEKQLAFTSLQTDELNQLKITHESLIKEYQASKNDVTKGQDMLKKFEGEIETFKCEAQNYKQQIASLTEQISKFQFLETQLNDLNMQLTVSNSNLSQSHEQLKLKDEELNSFVRTVKKLKEELSQQTQLLASSSSNTEMIAQFQNEISLLRDERVLLVSKTEALNKAIAERDNALQLFETKMDEASNQILQYKSEMHALQTENQSLKTSYEDLKASIERLRSDESKLYEGNIKTHSLIASDIINCCYVFPRCTRSDLQ